MEDQCMVMCGQWLCGEDGKWDFVVDKSQMARLVPMKEGISLTELRDSICNVFDMDPNEYAAALSYWPPTTFELATGIRTPPVSLTTDGGVRYFVDHMKVKGGMNLFVKFEVVLRESDNVDDTGLGFVTPSTFSTRIHGRYGSGFGQTSSTGPRVCSKPIPKAQVPVAKGLSLFGSIPIPKAPTFNLDEEEDFVRNVEKVEEAIKGCPTGTCSADVGEVDEVDGVDDCSDGVDGVDERYVRPCGYDREFWSPLLNGDFGGSNALDVIYNEEELTDDLSKKKESMDDKRNNNHAFSNVGGSRSGADGLDSGGFDETYPWIGRGMGSSGAREGDGNPRVSARKLDDVGDEEFDIPPLFDDTDYAAAEIPDMDLHELDGSIFVGKVFANKEDCQISLAIYAIKNQFQFKQTRTKLDSFVVECPDNYCDWRVTAHEIRGTGYYEIRKAQLDHRCPIEYRNGFKSKATSRVIAAIYRSQFGDPGKGPVPRDLQKLVLEDLRVSASYMKCYRAKEKAIEDVRGSDEDSYLKLAEYLHMLKLANPGTIADLETEVDEDGDERFVYLFLAFGASISGFKKLRLVLVIDGTHLGGKYKGVLLTASGQDANFQIFPLAYAVVDCENEEAWTWFLMKVERILGDSPRLAIISDRATCISNAVKRVYPMAHHGACIVHLARNVNSRFRSKKLAKLVTATAKAYRARDYKDLYSKVRASNSACGVYLGKIGVGHWTRANFRGERYNIMTSNIAEQLNKALIEGRGSPILELVIFIQRMMTRWFNARRTMAGRHRGIVSVEVDKEMTKNMANMKGSKVHRVTNWTCEIVGKFGGKERVMLGEKQCSCKYFDKLKIPCGHAMIAADSLGVTYETLVSPYYKTSTWRETYAGIISPEGDPRDVEIPENIKKMVLMPPTTKRLAGRRRKNRIPSIGEFKVTKKTKLVPNKCGRCRLEGHNRARCTNPLG